ncbi:hypothetical protein [Ferroplasma sp.]|uniref:hypothetical protein n=1 Tax=Ferroplasma sp. TaxID=2591003 RepID=UPI00307F0B09
MDISDGIQLDNVSAMILMENKLSKAMHQYFHLVAEEGTTYIKDYLKERRKQGEEFSC